MVLLPLMFLWLRSPMFFPRPLRWLMLLLFCAVAGDAPGTAPSPTAAAESPAAYTATGDSLADAAAGQAATDAEAVAGDKPAARQREGTELLNTRGRFAEVGRRWVFTFDDGSRSYRVLENLALQRIVHAIRQDAEDNRWTVQGTLTEFDEHNLLLLKTVVRAIQPTAEARSASSP